MKNYNIISEDNPFATKIVLQKCKATATLNTMNFDEWSEMEQNIAKITKRWVEKMRRTKAMKTGDNEDEGLSNLCKWIIPYDNMLLLNH